MIRLLTSITLLENVIIIYVEIIIKTHIHEQYLIEEKNLNFCFALYPP